MVELNKIPEFLKLNVCNDLPTGEDQLMQLEQEVEHVLKSAKVYAPKQERIPVDQPNTVPYLKQDFDGDTLYIASLMKTQTQAAKLIALVTGLKPFLEDDTDHDHA